VGYLTEKFALWTNLGSQGSHLQLNQHQHDTSTVHPLITRRPRVGPGAQVSARAQGSARGLSARGPKCRPGGPSVGPGAQVSARGPKCRPGGPSVGPGYTGPQSCSANPCLGPTQYVALEPWLLQTRMAWSRWPLEFNGRRADVRVGPCIMRHARTS
jgi:hypothetical protein